MMDALVPATEDRFARIELPAEAAWLAVPGALAAAVGEVEVDIQRGSLGTMLRRIVTGASPVLARYQAKQTPASLVLATASGSLVQAELRGGLKVRAGAFFAGSPDLTLAVAVTRWHAFVQGLPVVLRIHGSKPEPGPVLLRAGGAATVHELAADEAMLIDADNLLAFDESIESQQEIVQNSRRQPRREGGGPVTALPARGRAGRGPPSRTGSNRSRVPVNGYVARSLGR